MMLAFAGVVGYCGVSAWQRGRVAKKIVSRTNTVGCTNVMVIYKSHWLCPNLNAVVIGFKDDYISDAEKNHLLNEALKCDNPNEIIEKVKRMKPNEVLSTNSKKLVNGQPVDGDGSIIDTERAWVLPALFPGGLSIHSFSRSTTTNKLVWTGSARSWTTWSSDRTSWSTIPPPTQPPPQ